MNKQIIIWIIIAIIALLLIGLFVGWWLAGVFGAGGAAGVGIKLLSLSKSFKNKQQSIEKLKREQFEKIEQDEKEELERIEQDEDKEIKRAKKEHQDDSRLPDRESDVARNNRLDAMSERYISQKDKGNGV